VASRTPKPIDRRVLRTRRMLHGSLMALVRERGWDTLSVQDICDRAEIGRSTFYAHFGGKEALLAVGFEQLRKMLRARLERNGTGLQWVRGLIVHAHEHWWLFGALVGRRSGHVVMQRLRKLAVDLVREDLSATWAPGHRRDAAVHFIGGALFELLTWSVEARGAPPPAEIERIFFAMIAGALKALRS
jgi:AcrR family transcriptional regulator